MKHLSVKEQLRVERKKNERLQSKITKQKADIDYIAMMADIELMTEDIKTEDPNMEVNKNE